MNTNIYQVVFNPKNRKNKMGKIALVKDPAIQTMFIKLSEEDEPIKLILNNDKMIVTGPVLIPDQKIWRNQVNGYITFDVETISLLQSQYSLNNDLTALDIEHTTEDAGGYVIETWISGKNDKSQDLGYDLPIGTWFMSTQITDPILWDKIKNNEINGYSIEAIADLIEIKMKKQTIKMSEQTLKDGTVIYSDSEEIDNTSKVYSDPELTQPLVDGEYPLPTYTSTYVCNDTFVVKSGVIAETKSTSTQEEIGMSEDKVVLAVSADTATAVVVDPTPVAPTAEDFQKLTDSYNELQKIVADLQSKVAMIENANTANIKQSAEMNEQIMKLTTNVPVSEKDKKFITQEEIELRSNVQADRITELLKAIKK